MFLYRVSKENTLPLALKTGLTKETAEPVPFSRADSIELITLSDPKKRGKHKLDRLYIESRFPFGLVLAWTWLKLDAECLVFPQPLYAAPDSSSLGHGDKDLKLAMNGELNELREYQHSDSSGRILWKKYASKDQLIVRDYEEGSYSPEWVDWDYYSAPTEMRLKHLCYDVCQLSEGSRAFGFRIPGVVLAPDIGELHKLKCLDALALFNNE